MANDGYKGNLKAERVVWMSRTSDVIGSHLKKDMDSYLTLIRRKIQEKCSTTQELINQIRKTKVGDGSFVTPNEFRFTLIKFGLIFPQSLVDRIFAVFDSDRSGTMDFDEFAMWIMNSEFRPVVKSDNTVYVSPEEQMRLRLDDAIRDNPTLFKYMKREVSYLDLISAVNQGQTKTFNERDARMLFQILDSKKGGFIESKKIVRWATTGQMSEPISQDSSTAPSLQKCMVNICGRNFNLLEHCFSSMPKNSVMKLGFDEFRTFLLAEGLGRNRKHVEQFFVALGGQYAQGRDGGEYSMIGHCDIDLLLSSIPHVEGGKVESLEKRPATCETIFSRADRRLRDAVRKCYKVLKSELETIDTAGTGFIEPERLLNVINKCCTPLTYEDFRKVISTLNTDGDKVCWQHFLHMYNPKKAPHMLEGNRSVPEFVMPSPTKADFSSTTPGLSRTDSPTFNPKSNGDGYDVNLKRAWQSVLRECQRNDPERTGLVSRITFVNALESNSNGAMSSDSIGQLANKYTNTESGGLVDYVSCFRNYLNDIASNMATSTSASTFRATSMNSSRVLKGQHPWEFHYARPEKKDAKPYWKLACTEPRNDPSDDPSKYSRKNFSTTDLLSSGMMDERQKDKLLKKFDPRLIIICTKCPALLQPIYKELKTEFKRARHDINKNEILTPKFFAVMQAFNIDLTSGEMGVIARAFRAKGMPECVKYEEFMDLCKVLNGKE